MNAEDTPDDTAKSQVEERAERELQLKIDTLELERDKFRYARVQGFYDRVGAIAMRGTTALLFATGSTILLGVTSYKSIVEVLSKPVLERCFSLLFIGFLLAAVAFVAAMILSMRVPEVVRKWDFGGLLPAYLCTAFSMGSFAALGMAFVQIITVLRKI